jgi:hypothetical protein
MYTILKVVGVLVFCLMISSCKKDETAISAVPEITFVSVTPTAVKEFQDSLIFTISYKDGDGDLGENSPDVKNLFLTDNRIGVTYSYRIQQLAPDGANISIQGNLNTVLKNIAITDSSASQQATFSIYVVDRAGNKSNTVNSSVVNVSK